MSWREVLGVENPAPTPPTQNTHNPQKASIPGSSANIAYIALVNPRSSEKSDGSTPRNSAYIADSAEEKSRLFEDLSTACSGLSITPTEVHDALSQEDMDEWRTGDISLDTLAAFARSLEQRREMDEGIIPKGYTEIAFCRHCGPVRLWFAGEVLSCPWCLNRTAGRPIPRLCAVQCGECLHFNRIDHPHLGHCAKGEPEAIVGNWDTDSRGCDLYIPKPDDTVIL